jgi:tetratricopeptide (TPR) repeat protein
LTEHPSAEELLNLVRGKIAPQRGGEVLRHLYAGCEKCLAAAPAGLAAGLGVDRAFTAKEEAATETAIDRAFAVALRENRKRCRQKALQARAVKILIDGGVKGPEELPRSMKQIDIIEALLAASWSSRYENPGMMVYFAQFAVTCAERLDASRHGSKDVFDLQCRAQAELGNAYRVSDQFDKANAAFARARQLFELGSHSELAEIRLLSLEASLDSDCRRLKDACTRLKKVLRYRRLKNDDQLTGRTLLQLGRFTNFSGDPEEGLRLINESLSLLDIKKDPSLFSVAKQNQIESLILCRRHRDAELQLFQLRAMTCPSVERVNELRLKWLLGRIEAGQDKFARAEKTLREVHEGWIELGSGYNSALVALELAAMLLAQGKASEATQVVATAYTIFSALKVQSQVLMAVLVLRMSCEIREATRERVDKIVSYLQSDINAELEA